ncbi:unnamed protein product [Sphacelaria rigidula]
MWASDCERLEAAHQRGDDECLVYGRKYVVDMKVSNPSRSNPAVLLFCFVFGGGTRPMHALVV